MRSLVKILILFILTFGCLGFGPFHHMKVADESFESVMKQVKMKFPSMTERQLQDLQPYYLAGSVGPDFGFFPGGQTNMSLLSHYLRTGDLASTLIQISRTPQELAFSLGWRSHVDSDPVAHVDSVNLTVAEVLKVDGEHPTGVTYGFDELAHNRVESGADVHLLNAQGVSGELEHDLRVPIQKTFSGDRSLIEEAYLRVYGFKVERTSLVQVSKRINDYLDLIPGVFVAMGYLKKEGRGPLDDLISVINQVTIRPLFVGIMQLNKDTLGSQAILDPYKLTPHQITRHKRATAKAVTMISSQIIEDHLSISNKNLDTGKLTVDEVHDPSMAILLSLESKELDKLWASEFSADVAKKLIKDWRDFKESFLKAHQ